MIPTVDQLLLAVKAVHDLADPLVEWEPSGVFGVSGYATTPVLDSAKVYVNLHAWRGELTFCVKKIIREEPMIVCGITIPGNIMCWNFALPPWKHAYDLPPLDIAVAMLQLPKEAFPKP
mgnify:CR=1 FL=1